MQLTYLGTAAAEGAPALFCTCRNCQEARKTGGRDIRTRSQALLNDDLMIDFPADTYWHEMREGLDLSAIRHYVITHVHEDHFYPLDLDHVHRPSAANPPDFPHFHVYGSGDVRKSIRRNFPGGVENLEVHELKPYRTTAVGRYQVTPVKANHGTDHPLNYVISDGEKTVFYDHDSGLPFEETWECFRKKGFVFDLVSMDCTHGNVEELSYSRHMCFGWNKKLREMLLREGMATEKTLWVVNHFSHNGENINWEESHEIYEREGFLMSYDDMKVEF